MKENFELSISRKVGFWFLFCALLLSSNINAAEQVKFNSSGIDAVALGESNSYSGCPNPLQARECRVGAWSGQFWTSKVAEVPPSKNPYSLPMMKNPPDISYRWNFSTNSVDDYLADTKNDPEPAYFAAMIYYRKTLFGSGPKLTAVQE